MSLKEDKFFHMDHERFAHFVDQTGEERLLTQVTPGLRHLIDPEVVNCFVLLPVWGTFRKLYYKKKWKAEVYKKHND